MARQVGLHLICKMRHDSALYIPYENPDPTRKSRRKYGEKINYSFIPERFFKETNIKDDIRTDINPCTTSTQGVLSSIKCCHPSTNKYENFNTHSCGVIFNELRLKL